MSQDVTQWLAEIKSLQQQLAQAQKDREDAYASVASWQRLYETEAQQRRLEANLARETIARLTQENLRLKGRDTAAPVIPDAASAFQAEVAQLQTVEALRSRLVQVLVECDRLNRALDDEKEHHAQTRNSLTMALGDAIDMLSKSEGR
jgi:predicted  nucleic acid-binding Zn-ribbon protein